MAPRIVFWRDKAPSPETALMDHGANVIRKVDMVVEGKAERNSLVGYCIVYKLLYYNYMRFLITLLLLINTSSAMACSYIFPSATDALTEIDYAFEADIHAVYVNEQQVPTALLARFLAGLDKPATLRYRLKPTRVYVGNPGELIDVYLYYDRYNSCSNDYRIKSDDFFDIWGVSRGESKNVGGNYYDHVALSARRLLTALENYQSALRNARGTAKLLPKAYDLLQRDLDAVTQQLNIRKGDQLGKMVSSYEELEAFPPELLLLRSCVLDLRPHLEELAKTTTILVQSHNKIQKHVGGRPTLDHCLPHY